MRFLFIILAAAFFFLSSCKEMTDTKAVIEEAPQVDMEQVKAEIQALEKAWGEAQSTKDINTLMSFYADDAISMPDGAPTLSGKEAIKTAMEANYAKAPDGMTSVYTVLEVYGDGETVTEIGTGATSDTTGTVIRTGKYFAIWQKRDGKYLCIREIYNSDAPAKK